MARKRLSMRKIRDVLRLKYGLGRSNREIGAMLRISHSTVGSYVRRAREAGVSWPLPDDPDDGRLEAALYPPTAPSRVRRPEPDWARVHRELARHKGVTLQLLWFEYREAHPDGYQYSRFCDRYRDRRGPRGQGVRRGAGGVEPHVRRCGPDPIAAGLDGITCAHVRDMLRSGLCCGESGRSLSVRSIPSSAPHNLLRS